MAKARTQIKTRGKPVSVPRDPTEVLKRFARENDLSFAQTYEKLIMETNALSDLKKLVKK